jgi:hypothetical protein
MALNLIEKVALPSAKPDSRKRKRSDDSGSGTGSGSGYQHNSGQVNPRSGLSGGQPRAGTGNQRAGMQQAGSHGYGSGFGYTGSGQVCTRSYSPSHNSNQSRGRAGSVTSRGASGSGYYNNQYYQGYRGGGGGGDGGERGGGRGASHRGQPSGHYWPRW